MTLEPGRGRRVVWILSLAGIIVALVQTIVAPLLPSAREFLDTSQGTASWLVTATLMSGCIANPILGRLGDMYGKRRMILLGLGLLIAGSVVCACSSTIGPMIVGRTLQGTALALTPLATSVLRDELPRKQVPGGVAVVSATIGTGAAIGYPVAGLTIQFFDWHAMFWVTAVVGVLVLAMILVWVPESANRPGGRFDVVGSVTLGIALFLLLLGIERAAEWGWAAARFVGCLVAALLVGAVFVWYQHRAPNPLVNVRGARRAPVLMAHLAAGTVGFAFYANALATAQLVQEPTETGYGLGQSVLVGGLCVLPGGIAMVFLSPVSSRLSRRYTPAPVVQLGCACMAAGYLLHVVLIDVAGLIGIIVASSVVSAGAALAYSALTLLIMSVVPIAETGSANGVNTLLRVVGQSTCSAFTAASLGTFTVVVAGTPHPEKLAYELVFALAGLSAVAAALAARASAWARRRQQPAAREPTELELAELELASAPATVHQVDDLIGPKGEGE